MLRKIRIALAVLFFAGITLLFIGIGQDWWGWMAKLQLLPATFRLVGGATLGNIAVVAGVLLLTFLFGRVYCSIICPLGVFQDAVIFLRRHFGLLVDKINGGRARKYAAVRKEKGSYAQKPAMLKPIVKHFSYSPERKWIRDATFTVFVATAIALGQLLISYVAPYSAYGRMVQAAVGLSTGQISTALLITAAVTCLVITVCALFWGRIWCNTICPVGTLLGFISRYSLFRIRIDESKCAACGRCGRSCKASCIDMDAHKVDYSRCIGCFDCIKRCNEGAIDFSLYRKEK